MASETIIEQHVPDCNRCKKLNERGFKQKTEYIWVMYKDKSWVEHESEDAHFEFLTIAAPIVTELVEEIRKLLQESKIWSKRINLVCSGDGSWYGEPFYIDRFPLCDVFASS